MRIAGIAILAVLIVALLVRLRIHSRRQTREVRDWLRRF